MLLRVSLLLLTILIFAKAHADGAIECANKQLDEGQGSAAHLVTRNQSDLGICYAESAVLLKDAWRASHLPGDMPKEFQNYYQTYELAALPLAVTSALRSAGPNLCSDNIETSGQIKEFAMNGGQVCGVINNSMDQPACHEGYLQTAIWGLDKSTSSLDVKISKLEDFTELRQACSKFLVLHHKLRDIQNQDCKSNSANTALYEFLPIYAKAANDVVTDGGLSRLKGQLDKICSPSQFPAVEASLRPPPEASRCNDSPVEDRVTSQKKIRELFERPNAQPIAVAYRSCFLTSDSILPAVKNLIAGPMVEKNCGAHASVLVGSRPDPNHPGHCQYHLQNSWGVECRGYTDRIKCDPENGKLWVDADELIDQSYKLSYLE